MAVADGGDLVFLASGVLRQLAGTSSYTGCADEDARTDCHGLIVLAAKGVPGAVSAPPPVGIPTAPAAFVNPHGAARYRFQVSTEDRAWRNLGDRRYVVGSRYERVTAPAGGLEPGRLFRVRLELERRAAHETQVLGRDAGFFLAPRLP